MRIDCLTFAYTVVFIFTAFTVSVEADELNDLSLEELLHVKIATVSGSSRYEQAANEAPARVSIIDAATIRRFGYRTLAEALQGETGLNMSSDREYDYIGYRGLSRRGDYNSRVLVVLDGVRLNDEVYHQAPFGTDFPLDMDLIERIEVIRGPSNSLYGNNAFYLTINIISTSAKRNGVTLASSVDTRAKASGRITAEADPLDTDWSLLVSGAFVDAPGSDVYLSAFNTPDTSYGRSHGCDYERNGSMFLKAEKGDVTLLGGYIRRRKGVPTGSYDVIFNDWRNTAWDERSFADLSYQLGNDSGDSLKIHGYYNGYFYSQRYAYPPDSAGDETFFDYSGSAVLGGEMIFSKHLPFGNHVVAGVDYHYALLRDQSSWIASKGTTLDLHFPQHSVGVFLQNEWRILPNLLLDVGARYDYFSPSLDTFNPKAALIYKIRDDLALKYLVGKSFRAPNAYETNYRDSTSNMVANPNLRQESMISHELVLEYYHGPGQQLSLTGFHYSIDDLISQVVESNGTTHFMNIGKIESKGIEAEGEWTWGTWSGRVGYSYARARDKQSGKRLTNSPESLVKARLSKEFPGQRLTISGELQYVSPFNTLDDNVRGGDYVLAHLAAHARDLLIHNLNATISVRNLLNKRYTHAGSTENIETTHPVALIPQDGRTVTFKLEYRF